MKNNGKSGAPAIAGPEDSLTILREVSEVYETLRDIRRRAAKLAHDDGATYKALGDAMGTTRSTAHTLLNGRAA
jgi:DNA-directed RNA polymerase specialized sigma24 family protein